LAAKFPEDAELELSAEGFDGGGGGGGFLPREEEEEEELALVAIAVGKMKEGSELPANPSFEYPVPLSITIGVRLDMLMGRYQAIWNMGGAQA
jgi:hypothetical protein